MEELKAATYVNNKVRINIVEVDNGFSVTKTPFPNESFVAKSKEEVVEIITKILNN